MPARAFTIALIDGCTYEDFDRGDGGAPIPPRNGAEARFMLDGEIERPLHLFVLNRGILLTPLHNMMLVSRQRERTT